MSNQGQLCRDGIFGNLQIKGKKVLDNNRNMCVENAKIKGNAIVRQDIVVMGNVFLSGEVIFCNNLLQ